MTIQALFWSSRSFPLYVLASEVAAREMGVGLTEQGVVSNEESGFL